MGKNSVCCNGIIKVFQLTDPCVWFHTWMLLYRTSCLRPFFSLCLCVPFSPSRQSAFPICGLIWDLHPHYFWVNVYYFLTYYDLLTFIADLPTHGSPPCLFYPSPFCMVHMVPIIINHPLVLLKYSEQLAKCHQHVCCSLVQQYSRVPPILL
jgi:hypothetical protein